MPVQKQGVCNSLRGVFSSVQATDKVSRHLCVPVYNATWLAPAKEAPVASGHEQCCISSI